MVWTSSTRSTDAGAAARAATTSRSPARRSSRPARVWRPATSCRASIAAQGASSRSASAAAIRPAGSNPRARLRRRCGGTGTTATAGSGGSTAASCAAISPAAGSAPRNFSAWTSARAPPSYAIAACARVERRARRRAAAAPVARQRAPRAAPPAQPRQRARAARCRAAPPARPAAPGRPGTAAARRGRGARRGRASSRAPSVTIACRVSRERSRMCARSVTRGAAQPATARPARPPIQRGASRGDRRPVGGRLRGPACAERVTSSAEVALASVAESSDWPAPPKSSSYPITWWRSSAIGRRTTATSGRPTGGIGEDAHLSHGRQPAPIVEQLIHIWPAGG